MQVDNPLEAEGNPNSLHQPQLQLNAPDGDVQGVKKRIFVRVEMPILHSILNIQ